MTGLQRVEDAARAEAERRYPGWPTQIGGWRHQRKEMDAFVAGAAWQAAQPVVVTADEFRAAVESVEWDEQNPLGPGLAFASALGITVEGGE